MVTTHLSGILAVVAALLAFPAAPQVVAPDGADREDFEARILAELAVVAPAAVEDARAASAAYQSRHWREVLDLYARVLAAAPGFDHALRRQCRARTALGDNEAAIPLCRAALALATTAQNELALADALMALTPGRSHPQGEIDEALALARRGLARAPGDASIAQEACSVALNARNLGLLQFCTGRLETLAPNELVTKYFGTIRALGGSEFREARRRLAEARSAGLPEDEASRLARAIDATEPAWSRWIIEILVVLGAWMAALPLLLIAGTGLSAATLRRARTMVTDREAGGRGSWLRQVYAVVLWLTCAIYYLSLPLLVLLLLATGYAVWVGIESGGGFPVRGVMLVGLTVLVSVWAVAMIQQVRGNARRCLILGVGLLDGLTS